MFVCFKKDDKMKLVVLRKEREDYPSPFEAEYGSLLFQLPCTHQVLGADDGKGGPQGDWKGGVL